MMREDERDRVCRQGTAAWKRLKSGKNWNDWIAVGEALQVGREWAMNQAGTNKPEGKAYNMTFGEWLTQYKLDDMDKGDRSRLFTVMDNLAMIQEWRSTLALSQRLKFNHPNAVLRRWRAAIEPEDKSKTPRKNKTAETEIELATALQTIEELEAHNQELEAARDAGAARDTSALTLEDLRERMASILLKLPKDERRREINQIMRAVDLNIHDWMSTMTIKTRSSSKAKAKPQRSVLTGELLDNDAARDRHEKAIAELSPQADRND